MTDYHGGGVPYAISPSMMKTFDTCPFQFRAKYKTKEVKFQQNPHGEFGDAVHKSFEAFLTRGKPLHPKLKRFEPILARMIRGGATSETSLAINRAMQPVGYGAKDAYLRIKVDAILRAGQIVAGFDWKTGKENDDWIQTDVTKLVLSVNFPDAEEIQTIFPYIFKGGAAVEKYRRTDPKLIGVFKMTTEMDNAWTKDNFPKNPSGLCKAHCDVVSCENNGKYTGA